jgi:hypothetical protein
VLVPSQMTASRAPTPADPADHPLRAALARGDRLSAQSALALPHLVGIESHALLGEAVVAQVAGMLADLARQLAEPLAQGARTERAGEALSAALGANTLLCRHCQALAIEWRLSLQLEAERSLDPVLSPLLQALAGDDRPAVATLAMAALAAQARFAQAQRRMELPLAELPAELFDAVLNEARATIPELARGEPDRRARYDEGASRLALLGRLAAEPEGALAALAIEEAGAALWLTLVAARAGGSRDAVAVAAADPHLARLLLTLRAAGSAPHEAERQAMILHPDALPPAGLQDIGTRAAAQWLAEAGA